MNTKTVLFAAAFAASAAFISCDESKPTSSNLAGAWELVCNAHLSYKDKDNVASSMELFNDGTGIADGTAIKWQLRDGNRLQIDGKKSEISDIELSEKGAVLTFHYDGIDFSGERPRKVIYIKKGVKKEGNIEYLASAFTDKRDGKKYKAVNINGQVWMAENLNFEAKGSKCYGEDGQEYVDKTYTTDYLEYKYKKISTAEIQANCSKYGRLYNWETAMKACPDGWHLPTKEEWEKLYRYADSYDNYLDGSYRCIDEFSDWKTPVITIDEKYLKAKDGWRENGNGADNFGFSALPGGGNFDLEADGFYLFLGSGNQSHWWSASDYDEDRAYKREITHGDFLTPLYGYSNKYNLLSIRCLQGPPPPPIVVKELQDEGLSGKARPRTKGQPNRYIEE